MQSMTGFGAAEGTAANRRWRWELKSVNGRGLDLRFRLADGLGADEGVLRAMAAKRLKRGSVTLQLREEGAGDDGALLLNAEALSAVIDAARQAEAAADAAGLSLAPASAADLLAIRGVMNAGSIADEDSAAEIAAALSASFSAALDALVASRTEEGARLAATLTGMIDQIETLSAAAVGAFSAHQDGAQKRLADKLAEFSEIDVDPDRLAQELALIAVKGDIREELDRLSTHIAAARDLIAAAGPVGRKLDFLTQEFNREANTLCSKSGTAQLTAVGLDLKVVIDQMREQAQNVE